MTMTQVFCNKVFKQQANCCKLAFTFWDKSCISLKSKAKISLTSFSHTFKIFWWNLPSTERTFCREKEFHPVLYVEDTSHPVPPPQVKFIQHPRKAHPNRLQQKHILLVNVVIGKVCLGLSFNMNFTVIILNTMWRFFSTCHKFYGRHSVKH